MKKGKTLRIGGFRKHCGKRGGYDSKESTEERGGKRSRQPGTRTERKAWGTGI